MNEALNQYRNTTASLPIFKLYLRHQQQEVEKTYHLREILAVSHCTLLQLKGMNGIPKQSSSVLKTLYVDLSHARFQHYCKASYQPYAIWFTKAHKYALKKILSNTERGMLADSVRMQAHITVRSPTKKVLHQLHFQHTKFFHQ
jgi:hypothetical protein